MSTLSATVLLILIMDPFGNLPVFVAALKEVQPERRWRVLLRELVVALVVLLTFLLAGRYVMSLLHISTPALSIAGGVILLLVSLRMVFPAEAEARGQGAAGEPFIVPMAVPLIAGPAAMTMLLILVSTDPSRLLDWVVALTLGWLVVSTVLLLSGFIQRLLGQKGLRAMVRLMGMILIVLAVQMFLNGVQAFLAAGRAAAQPLMK